ncbi:sterile alpha motif domain-containing protein 1-like [Menidia menidia]
MWPANASGHQPGFRPRSPAGGGVALRLSSFDTASLEKQRREGGRERVGGCGRGARRTRAKPHPHPQEKMSEPNKYREWILETIDSLRSRKARPDLERICRMVRRRHGSDPERTRAELDKLIQEQTVLKVSYKGSTSYRNAARVQRKSRNRSESADAPPERGSGGGGDTDREGGGPRPRPPRSAAGRRRTAPAAGGESQRRRGGVQGSTRSAGARGGSEAAETGADTRSQTSSPPSSSSSSSSPRRRHRQTQTAPLQPELRPSGGGPGSDPGPGPSVHGGRVRAGAERGGLRGPPGGNPSSDRLTKGFALQDQPSGGGKPPSPALLENEQMDKADEGEGQEPNEGGEEEDDDDDDGPGCDEGGGASLEAKTTRSGRIENIAAEAGIQKASGVEAPLDGKQGSAGMSGLGVFLVLQAPPAQGPPLPQCNGAHVEERAANSDPLHTEARSPGERDDINPTPSMGYNSVESKTEVGAPSCMLTPTASPGDSYLSEDRGSNNSSGGLMKCESVKGSPVDWTVSDVVNYFTEAGFPEQAAAFRIQEIDGKSLLLMQRNDVLTGLSIRLGPALKIYERHVKVLQKTHFEDDDC